MIPRVRTRVLFLALASAAAALAGNQFFAGPGEAVAPNEYLVKVRPGFSGLQVVLSHIPGAQVQALHALNLQHITVPASIPPGLIAALASDQLVDFVEPNRLRHTTVAPPNDASYASQWDLPVIQALQAWSVMPAQYLNSATAGAGRIKVAVLDTGVDCTHPDFINAGGTSTDSAHGGQLLFSSSQALVTTTVPSAACAWQDDFGHGTHVAGTVAAATQNGAGVAALGYPVQVIAYKVMDSSGSGTDSTIANAIMMAADAGARVISLSLGGAGYSQSLQAAVNYAWQRNLLVVAAAGNDGSNETFFPAGATYAVAVAATDGSNAPASFSNYGPNVAIAAPGVSIFSTLPTYSNKLGATNYGSLSGTSMATPHVSALAGLLWTASPGAPAAAVLRRIQQTAMSTIANGGWDQHIGYGVINAYNALSGTLRTASTGTLRGQIVDSSANPVANAHHRRRTDG